MICDMLDMLNAEAEIERLQKENAVLRAQRQERIETAELLGQLNDGLQNEIEVIKEELRGEQLLAQDYGAENKRLRAFNMELQALQAADRVTIEWLEAEAKLLRRALGEKT
jgi:hypothetical protein